MSEIADERMLLTVALRHGLSKSVAKLLDQLTEQGYCGKFPPEGVEVVGRYVMIALSQAVTLRFPAHRLRELNRAVEGTARGRVPHRDLRHLRLSRGGARSAAGAADAGTRHRVLRRDR